VTVIVTAAKVGPRQEDPPTADDFEFFARVPDGQTFGSTVCDDVELVCRAVEEGWDPYMPPWFFAQVYFERKVEGQWENVYSNQPKLVDNHEQVSYIWHSTEDKNVAAEWRAKVELDNTEQDPPDNVLTLYLPVETWTPDNTVVKATGDEIILHHEDDESHTISWNIAHHVGNGVDPRLTVTVKIYNLAGSTVATLEKEDVQAGADSLPENNGIYTYRIVADHVQEPPGIICIDSDKSGQLEITNVHYSDLAWVEFPTRASLVLHYSLSRAAADCRMKLYKHHLSHGRLYEPTGGGCIYPARYGQ